jgi:dTDP-4-dehydrorhamnose 3,5-epimerase
VRCVGRPLPGMLVLETEPRCDQRGFFARVFCRHELRDLGAEPMVEQANLSYSERRGTLRGLHYQAPPHDETKIVRCTRGAVYDVAVDLRPASATYLSWTAVELSAENRRALYVPAGCAHGYLTLEPLSELHYLISQAYAPEAARGVRWDDPRFGIGWPAAPAVISERDASYPDFSDAP